MRAGWLLALLPACAAGANQASPDAGPALASCETSADCDDGESCTTDVCAGGLCGVSAIDRCAASSEVLVDDFESQPGRLVDDETLGGWIAVDSDDCPVGVETRLDDRFDDYGKPSAFVNGAGGWRLASAAGGVVDLVTGEGGGYAMRVMGTTAAGSYGQVMHHVTAQPSGEVELRFMAAGPTKQKWITLDEGDRSRFFLYFEADGLVKYSSGGSKHTLRSYAGDVWYTIRFSWDAGADRVDLSIDGTEYNDLPLHEPIERHINRLRFRTATASGLSYEVDDVVASGGDRVKDGSGSLRIGSPQGTCEQAASASRDFAPVATGALEMDLLADQAGGAYSIELTEAGAGGIRLDLEPGGGVSIREGDAVTALPATWRPGEWLHVELRWADTVDLWIGDGEEVTASGLDAARISGAGIDRVRVSVPPSGALWVDELRLAGAE